MFRKICIYIYIYNFKNIWQNNFAPNTRWRVGGSPDSSVGIATGWTVRGSNPSGGEIFRSCSDRPWGPPSLPYNGFQVFPGGKERPGVTLYPHPLLVPWSRKITAIPLLPLWAVRTVHSLSACTRVRFNFYLLGDLQRASPSDWWKDMTSITVALFIWKERPFKTRFLFSWTSNTPPIPIVTLELAGSAEFPK